MMGIHYVFPTDNNNFNGPISEKKLIQRDEEYAITKTILGIDFDAVNKTIWLEEANKPTSSRSSTDGST